MTADHGSRQTQVRLNALGSNGKGQLGLGHVKDVSEPEACDFSSRSTISTIVPLQSNECIKKIVGGGNHTLLLTSQGRVFTSGSSTGLRYKDEVEQLNSPTSANAAFSQSHYFRLVDFDEHEVVSEVSASWTASYFVVHEKILLCTGDGQQTAKGKFERPDLIVLFDAGPDRTIVSISSAMAHNVMLLSDGTVYGWGMNQKKQLSDSFTERQLPQPKWLDVGFPVRRIACGRDFSVFADENHLLIRGKSSAEVSAMQIGPGDEIYASWSSVTVKSKQGSLRSFGSPMRSRLPDLASLKIAKLVVGSEHTVALLTDGRVVSWGWGEHGNCGRNVDDKGNVYDHFNVLFEPGSGRTAIGIGAGCATTFFWVEEDRPEIDSKFSS